MSASSRKMLRSTRAKLLLVVGLVGIYLLASMQAANFTQQPQDPVLDHDESTSSRHDIDPEKTPAGDRRFVVVVPADDPNPDLCKVVTSAIALGYPSPVVLNWGKDFNKHGKDFGSSHLGKITGTLEYLEEMTRSDADDGDRLSDDDLVLVVDAYDVWFQLPPEVMLRRYHAQNQEADRRLEAQWPGSSPVEQTMRQSIIVSTQKRCWPTPKDSPSRLHCHALPESPLRRDLYGPGTDTRSLLNPWHDYRPRFLNSGTILGPAGDMRRYFRRVKEKMDRTLAANGGRLASDQGVFAEVLGEQEIWRTWRRDRAYNSSSGVSPEEAVMMAGADFEFGVGLDYSQQMSLPTNYEEHDGQFVLLKDEDRIEQLSHRLGISPKRLSGVPSDLALAHNPLRDVAAAGEAVGGWDAMPVYADFFTTAVPVILHHNAYRLGRKYRRTQWWSQTWFFPHLRALLELRLNARGEAPRPLATLPARGGGSLTYWAPASDATKKHPRVFEADEVAGGQGLAELEFGELCRWPTEDEGSWRHWYDEVFRDGKGPI
ncbi:hypothetical protein S40293_05266 [Stachybotrys chartarum IBT 40293]|nr:hypothetical protein S40293_05266 [Stachybotrys chartarum IBT 40293]